MKFEPRLDTRQASTFLTELGFKTASSTLNKHRCVGGGPEFELFGRRPLYTETALLEWVQSRTTGAFRSSSDGKNKTVSAMQSPQRPIVRSRQTPSGTQPRVK